jgi:hypothetical protein
MPKTLTTVAIAGATMVVGAAGSQLACGSAELPSSTASAFLEENQGAPREFLYLDSVRTDAYLSQLKGGNETLRSLSDKLTSKGGAEIGAGGAKLSAEVAREQGLDWTVSPTASSNFYALVQLLNKLDELPTLPAADGGGALPEATPTPEPNAISARTTFMSQWKDVDEADIVRFIATVRRPELVRVYQALAAAPPGSTLGRAHKQLEAALGPVPRVPLMIDVVSEDDQTPSMRLVLPAQPAHLSPEPTLLAPRLTVVAKVIQRMDESRAYGDLAFSDRFEPLVERVPESVLKKLGVRRSQLEAELDDLRAWDGPSAVLLPIALYK